MEPLAITGIHTDVAVAVAGRVSWLLASREAGGGYEASVQGVPAKSAPVDNGIRLKPSRSSPPSGAGAGVSYWITHWSVKWRSLAVDRHTSGQHGRVCVDHRMDQEANQGS